MVSSASRKKVTAVLSETRMVEQMELMPGLSAEELSLLETRIVERLGDKPSDRLKKLRATVRLITLLRAAVEVLFRESSEQFERRVNKALGKKLRVIMRKGESRG